MHDVVSLGFAGAVLYSVVRAPFAVARIIKLSRKRTATAMGTVLRVRLGRLHWGVNVPKPDIEFVDARGQRIEFTAS
jgi:hypothetical protein